jgi:hypothetical protein
MTVDNFGASVDVARLLVQDRVAPSPLNPGFTDVQTALEVDGELFVFALEKFARTLTISIL